MLFSAAALFSELKAFEASTSKAASVSSASKILRMACIAASPPLFWPVHTCMAPLALITSCFATLVTHLPIILLITSPTPIGRTSPLPLSSGIRRLATIGSMVSGSTNSVHSLLVSVAIDSHRLLLDLLKDLHAKILLKPFSKLPSSKLFCFTGLLIPLGNNLFQEEESINYFEEKCVCYRFNKYYQFALKLSCFRRFAVCKFFPRRKRSTN